MKNTIKTIIVVFIIIGIVGTVIKFIGGLISFLGIPALIVILAFLYLAKVSNSSHVGRNNSHGNPHSGSDNFSSDSQDYYFPNSSDDSYSSYNSYSSYESYDSYSSYSDNSSYSDAKTDSYYGESYYRDTEYGEGYNTIDRYYGGYN